DSGCTGEIEYWPEQVHVPQGIEVRLRQIAEAYCPDGYENNDGGYGSLTVYPDLGVAERAHRDRYEDMEGMKTQAMRLPASLRQRLAKWGILRITAHFDGCGDSGQIDDLTVEPEGISLDDKL